MFKQSHTPSPPASTSSTMPFPSLSIPSHASGVAPGTPVVEALVLRVKSMVVPTLGPPLPEPPTPDTPLVVVALPASVACPASEAPPEGFSVDPSASALELQLAHRRIMQGSADHEAAEHEALFK